MQHAYESLLSVTPWLKLIIDRVYANRKFVASSDYRYSPNAETSSLLIGILSGNLIATPTVIWQWAPKRNQITLY